MSKHHNFHGIPFIISLLFLSGCGDTNTSNSRDEDVIPTIGTDETIEIVTWNIEQFPKDNLSTVNEVSSIIRGLDADIYCIQEIRDKGSFIAMANGLEGYEYVVSQQSSNLNLGILYKDSLLDLRASVELFTNYSYEYAGRPPLRADFLYVSETDSLFFTVLVLHLKCCSGSENLQRRRSASTILHSYLINELDGNEETNFVIAGDWNDELDDPGEENAFTVFLDDTTRFKFVNYDIATSGSVYQASYPSWPSYIDHILISEFLFDEYETSTVKTIRLDDFLDAYELTVSDHRPVTWIFTPNF